MRDTLGPNMSAPDSTLNPQQTTTDSVTTLVNTASALANQANEVIRASKSGMSRQRKAELHRLLQELKATVEQLPDVVLETQSGLDRTNPPTSDTVYGVAFAAGSIPAGTWRTVTHSMVGLTFAAGLLLGLLLRRR